jgi:hypothetical protein
MCATEAARSREALLAREEAATLQAVADASKRWYESQQVRGTQASCAVG